MKIIITGGSGFLGSKLSEALINEGHEVISLDTNPPRNPKALFLKVNLQEGISLEGEGLKIKNPDVVINLAGVTIGAKWNEEYKKKIYNSRVLGTKNLVSLMENPDFRPKVFISASAVGVYSDRGAEILGEDAEIKENQGFLAKVAKDWENEAKKAEKHGIRTVILRQGHILGMGGLIQTLLPYYKMGIGGPISSGKQYFPWIHIEDLVNLYIYSIYREVFGVVNAVSGEPITNKEFSKVFARVLGRPHIFFIPLFVLKIKFGEFANEVIKSQRVVAKKIGNDFKFKFENLESALKNIFS
jgi:uncharacterized protein (TIGR01777 family)